MKPRARRVAVATAVLGAGALAVVLTALRDHIEAWRFQLTRDTKTVPQDCGDATSPPILCLLARSSGWQVIFDARDAGSLGWSSDMRSPQDILNLLRGFRWRVLEQRFPRRAFVVIRDGHAARPDS
jgi:hypothetical protein